MYKFSSKTEINKSFKTTDWLKQIKASKEARAEARKIKSIVIKNVISSSTINCSEDLDYKNIYIIEITLKEPLIPLSFIKESDNKLSAHTYFVLKYDNKISTYIAYKEGNRVVGDYYHHDFHDISEISPPVLNSVAEIYKLLLEYEIKHVTGIGCVKEESPSKYINRIVKINKTKKEIKKLEKAINSETQPKKQFAYNKEKRQYEKDLKELSETED